MITFPTANGLRAFNYYVVLSGGVIDIQTHSHPDVFGRNMDDIDVAQLAKARGMRGIVLKNDVSETVSRAALVMKVVPGREVFGGTSIRTP